MLEPSALQPGRFAAAIARLLEQPSQVPVSLTGADEAAAILLDTVSRRSKVASPT